MPARNADAYLGGSQVTRRRRRLGAWLLVGWLAFWLTTVIAPCCDSLFGKAEARQELTAIQLSVLGAAGSDQREIPCPELSHAQPTLSAPADAFFDTPSIAPPLPTALRALPVVKLVKPYFGDWPPPIPFHLRTARLLI